jgi:purine-binding chemotaxis protein CheW
MSDQEVEFVTSHAQAKGDEYLCFELGNEHYAIDIMQVKEIKGYQAATKVANAPPFVKGVINLRGDIVPIIDLRIKFDIGEAIYNQFTIVIMLNIEHKIIGIVVDAVSDVIKLEATAIKPPPDFGISFDSEYLLGLIPLEETMVTLIDIEKLITSDELGLFNNEQHVLESQ